MIRSSASKIARASLSTSSLPSLSSSSSSLLKKQSKCIASQSTSIHNRFFSSSSSDNNEKKILFDVVPKEDFGQFKEYSVIFTNRALNLMSDPFQKVMRDLNTLLKTTYNATKVAIIPGWVFDVFCCCWVHTVYWEYVLKRFVLMTSLCKWKIDTRFLLYENTQQICHVYN